MGVALHNSWVGAGMFLFLVALSILVPVRLGSRTGCSLGKARVAVLRASLFACLVAHAWAVVETRACLEEMDLLGTRVTPKDLARGMLGPIALSATGWLAVAWAGLLVALFGFGCRRGILLPIVLEAVAAGVVIVLLERGYVDPTDLGRWGHGGDPVIPPEAVIGTYMPYSDFPASLRPLGWLFVPAGVLATAWALSRRGRSCGEEVPATTPPAGTVAVTGGLFVLSSSMVWILGIAREPLEQVVLLGRRLPEDADLLGNFLSSAAVPGVAALLGLVVLAIGAVRLRRRPGSSVP